VVTSGGLHCGPWERYADRRAARGDEFERTVTRAALVVRKVGVVDAALGDGVQDAIGVYQAAVGDMS